MVCPSNEDAVAAARAVATTQPGAPNPLLILGAPADGKTHLVRALVAAYRRHHPDARTVVMSTEKLERGWRKASMQNALTEWRRELSQVGLLVIEDVQFMDRRDAWVPLLKAVVYDLRACGGFVVLTRDPPSPPSMVNLPAARVVRLHHPDFALRVAVAKKVAAELDLTIPDDVAEFIADHCENLRQVQGAVMRVHATSELIRHELWTPVSGWG